MTLSGGMKRRVMIAKALAHEPQDPVPRRTDRGRRRRAAQGYVGRGARPARLRGHHHPHHPLHRGSRNDGRPHRHHQQRRTHPGRGQSRADAQTWQKAADATAACRSSMGSRRVWPTTTLPLANEGRELVYTYDTQAERTGITALLRNLHEAGIRFRDLNTTQSSLEDIFVDLVRRGQ